MKDPAVGLWNRLRYPARIDLGLDWETSPLFIPGEPSTYWRVVTVKVVAARGQEVVVAEGDLQVRASPSGDWHPLGACSRELWREAPFDVEPNRSWKGSVGGPSVADEAEKILDPGDSLELQAVSRDHHGTPVESGPFKVTVAELRREKTDTP